MVILMTQVIQYTLGIANGFFVRDRGVIAVDSGSGSGREPFLRVCEECGIAPEDIRLLVVSHSHADHFVNIDEMKAVTGAPIMCHKNAERNLREAFHSGVRARNRMGRERLPGLSSPDHPVLVLKPVVPDIVVEGTVDLRPWGIDGRLVETFGHTDDCMSLILDSGEAIVGDLVIEDRVDGSASLACFYSGDDIQAANQQLFASVEYLLDNAETFYSGHGRSFTREEVVKALAAARAEAAEANE
jgi:hydroxyacylglutathione hydrolase